MEIPKITIWILNYNGLERLKQILPSILWQTYKNKEVLVVDNGSNDGSLEYLRNIEDVVIIENGKNLWYGAAKNILVKKISGEFVFMIDNDIEIGSEDFLAEIHKKYISQAKPSLMSVLVKDFDKDYLDSIWLFHNKLQDRINFQDAIGNWIIKVWWYHGNQVFFEKKIFEELWGFDEIYPFNIDDYDFSARASIYGYETVVNTDLFVIHRWVDTRINIGPLCWKNQYYFSGFSRTIWKNYKAVNIIIWWPFTALWLFVKSCKMAIKWKSFCPISTYFKSVWFFLRDFKNTLQKRKEIQKNRTEKRDNFLHIEKKIFKTNIAYVYMNDLENIKADTNQVFNMLNSLWKENDITFFSSWISSKNLKNISYFLNIKINFQIKKIPCKLVRKYLYLEYASRAIYSLFVSLYLRYSSKYNVIFSRDFGFIYFLWFLPKFLRPKQKIFFEYHKIYHETSDKVTLDREKKAIKNIDYFVVVWSGIKEFLTKKFDIKTNKIIVLSNGVNLKIFHHDYDFNPKDYKIKKTERIVIYSGCFLKNKWVNTLIKASHFIKSKNYKLVLVWWRGKELEKAIKFIKQEWLQNKIIIIDFLEQKKLIALLQNSHVAIVPNNKDDPENKYTSPLKLFEYMACGLPILISDSINTWDIVVEERNCLFFQADNEKDLAKKIDFLLENKVVCDYIWVNNFNKSKELSWDNRAKKLFKFIKNNINE